MFYSCCLFIFFLPSYCILFSGIVCTWLFPHPLLICFGVLYFLVSIFFFRLSSIYGFQFQVSGVFSLLLRLSLAFFSWDDTRRSIISSY